ncbi:TonB-dependent receptor [Compostibacter hankyongensis]|uniref:TonB-dependent receptor n=1 Tax=Compostibacter hankyongensis TaxID=1007089 RepID=A0ABP8FIP0_9BACT
MCYSHRFMQRARCICVTFLLILAVMPAFAQQNVAVHGRITGPDNQPVAGVTVMISGTQNGTTSGVDGRYSLNAHAGDSLIFHALGLQTQQVRVGASPEINIQLSSGSKGLNEVVVLGYGSQRRRDVTAAVSTIDVSKLRDVPATNVSRLLEGQAPGITVKQTTGAPGKEMQVRVRGLGSLGAGSTPLYVIDGFAVGNSIGQNLNPADIATITVLKDAVSTAIYGARGSNGVVLITTKQARSGETNLNVTANYGVQNVPDSRRTKVLNGRDFAEFKKEAFMDKIRYFENREPDLSEVPADFRNPEDTKYNTDWMDEILNRNASFQNYNITFSEGKGDVHSLISVGYIDQQGALLNTRYKNYSVRANVEGKVNNFINMGLNLYGAWSKQNTATTEGRSALVGSALLLDPREPVRNEDGSWNDYIGGHDGIFGFTNPVQALEEITRDRQIGDALTTGYLEFSFLRDFKFKTTGNARFIFDSYKQYIPSDIAGENAPPPRDATASDDAHRIMNLSADQLLTYAHDFGEHHLDAMVGFTAQEEMTRGVAGSATTFPDDKTPYLQIGAINSGVSADSGWSMLAYFTRVNYSYKDRYLFTGTFRREGSSRFGELTKWGNFPALSVGWRISDEPFMPKTSWLDDLKLRGSWGVTGNNNIGNYSSLAFMNLNNYVIGDQFVYGRTVSAFANPDLSWETSDQLDIGLDLTVLDNTLTFTGEYYNKITTDMLLPVPLPVVSGFTTMLDNIGKVRNRGFEFGLDYRKRINAVNVWGNFNIAFNQNKVLAMRSENDVIWNGTMYGDFNVSKVGRPIGMIYGFKNLGIFQNQKEIDESPTQDGAIPGVYKYYDANGDGVISYDQTDMVEIGNPWPKFTWGLNLGGSYQNIDLSVLLTGAQDYDVFRQIESSTLNMDGVFNVLEVAKQRWRSEDQPGIYPTTNTWKWERESNSRYVYDASHAWVKNISIGYTLQKSKLKFGSVRLYLSGDNLFLITKYPGNNPDVDNNGGINPGLDDEAYPVPRTFSIGANVTF